MTQATESTMELAETNEASAAAEAATSRIGRGDGKLGEVIIHARFHPTGLVNSINQRPEHLSPQEWFDRLCRAAPLAYQPLAGGRGVFRIKSDIFDAIWKENAV
ncbi:hypothetical protein [Methylocapsa aurea]|uniref:hypothetical protein n=1 Tax=Methylocapsa aurea TaxID=663610 RepID=UPI001FDAA271|nr:hypothetical protein [Methylocapsa aurea]